VLPGEGANGRQHASGTRAVRPHRASRDPHRSAMFAGGHILEPEFAARVPPGRIGRPRAVKLAVRGISATFGLWFAEAEIPACGALARASPRSSRCHTRVGRNPPDTPTACSAARRRGPSPNSAYSGDQSSSCPHCGSAAHPCEARGRRYRKMQFIQSKAAVTINARTIPGRARTCCVAADWPFLCRRRQRMFR
jgi:hypothetical protein